jgi:eukaryotic-like serine/threonine-protein kinase
VAASEAGVRRARRNRWALRLGVPLAVATVAAAVLAGVEWHDRRTAGRFVSARLGEADAAAREGLELDARVEAARTRAFELFDADDEDGGEASWRDALALGRREAERFGAAAEALGLALARDPRSSRTRAAAAELTYRWLLAAERDGEGDLVRELRDRLAALDGGHTWGTLLDAPARLRVTTVPAGGRVLVHRVRSTPEGRRVEDLGRAVDPGVPVTLEPGSYVLDAELAGRRASRLPWRLRRGDDAVVEVDLPTPADVPEGYLYVPAGWTLFGSSEVQAVRLTSATQPEHPVHVGAFLVAEHETTFGEYLRFLDSLPAPEREHRRPHSVHIDLSFAADGTPMLKLGDQRAQRGEPLCRPKRTVRRCQDWSRIPVVSIAWESAVAYARWVSATTVPGARLCTEREWVRAGRGADERTFPWGDRPLAGDANFEETYDSDADLMGADEVGSFPIDRSVFGVLDLAGNVTEWVADLAGSTDPGMRGAAGGATHQSSIEAPVNLHHAYVEGTYGDVGLRLCASPLGR